MYTSSLWSCMVPMSGAWQWHHRDVWMHATSGACGTFSTSRIQPMSVSIILKFDRELNSLQLWHSLSRDDSKCLVMLPKLTKLKITAVHCEHLSTHLVTGDGREDALVTPGYELSVMILNMSTMIYTQLIVKCKIILYVGRLWKQPCSHSGYATWWWWWLIFLSHGPGHTHLGVLYHTEANNFMW